MVRIDESFLVHLALISFTVFPEKIGASIGMARKLQYFALGAKKKLLIQIRALKAEGRKEEPSLVQRVNIALHPPPVHGGYWLNHC